MKIIKLLCKSKNMTMGLCGGFSDGGAAVFVKRDTCKHIVANQVKCHHVLRMFTSIPIHPFGPGGPVVK